MTPAARIVGASDSAAPAPLLLGPDRPEVVIHRPDIDVGATNEPPLRERRFLALLAVHGDEPCGVVAANRLLGAGFFAAAAADPSCPFDELRLVVGNPKALAAGVRFLDLNLNRCFKEDLIALGSSASSGATARRGDGDGHAGDGIGGGAGGGSKRSDVGPAPYEAARAAQLAPLIEAAGALLDIHSTSVPTPPFAFYVPGDSGAASAAHSSGGDGGAASSSSAAKAPSLAGAGPAAAEGQAQGQAQQQQQGGAQEGVPPEAELALSLPVAYVIRDYTGAGQGLAIEWAAAAAAAAGAAVRASCVECGSHQDPASVEVAEACLRAFATAGGTRTGEPGTGAAAAPRHVVARSGVIVRPGFRWLWGGGGSGGGGAPPAAFARVAAGQVVAADDEAGEIACPCGGGALVFMPAGAPTVGEDALLWAEDYP